MSLNKFKTNSMFHSHDTRTKSDVFITNHNTKLFKLLTTVFLFIADYLAKLKMLSPQ
jgi:hypothetical protein